MMVLKLNLVKTIDDSYDFFCILVSCYIQELAKRLNVTPPSITSMIKKMEQEGYIIRKADEQDQRVMRLTLAKKGKDCVAYVIKTAEKLEEIVFEGMTAEEKMLFRRLLLQILENVE